MMKNTNAVHVKGARLKEVWNVWDGWRLLVCTNVRETCRYKPLTRVRGHARVGGHSCFKNRPLELASWGHLRFALCTGPAPVLRGTDKLVLSVACRLVSCCERYRGFFLGSDDETCFAFLQVD